MSEEQTCSAESGDALTWDKLKGCIDKIVEVQEAPFRALLMSKNMNPDKDWIIFSEDAAKALGLTKENIPQTLQGRVKINPLVDGTGIFLVKHPSFGIEIPFLPYHGS